MADGFARIAEGMKSFHMTMPICQADFFLVLLTKDLNFRVHPTYIWQGKDRKLRMAEMKTTNLYIKNMVCPRCITAVRNILTEQGLTVHSVELGRAEVSAGSSEPDFGQIDAALQAGGFALLQDRDRQIVERIKNELLAYLYALEEGDMTRKVSAYISDKIGFSYDYLSKLFSQYEHTTIEKYLIHLKIERVKELLSYGELTLSEIAYRLHYSSPQHLSRQFKQITGITVSAFKQRPFVHRHPLDRLPE